MIDASYCHDSTDTKLIVELMLFDLVSLEFSST